ncbi:MAG: PilT/PilU family type 4a pilus ATPase [Armatimonadota bacterium]
MVIANVNNTSFSQLLNTIGNSPAQLPLPPHAIRQAVEAADAEGVWVGKKLVDDGLFSGDELAELLSRELDIPLANLEGCRPEPEALAQSDLAFCRRHYLVPVRLSLDCLYLLMANPLDTEVIGALAAKTRRKVEIAVAPIDRLLMLAQSWYAAEPAPALAAAMPAIFHHRSAAPATDEDQTPYDCGIADMLKQIVDAGGSDLHLTAGSPPRMRLNGQLKAMPLPKLMPHHLVALVSSLMTERQRQHFEEELELDFSFGMEEVGRFRANIFIQRGSVGAIFRAIPSIIPTLDALGMPLVLHNFVKLERGLVLVTGPTGSGKSTTLAAIIDEMNRTRCSHIVTLEDPIEYVHWHGKCEINQRQVGADTKSFLTALKHVLRQDPDVILIGELRDLETITAAMTAAETGHLVLATLHTNGAAETIDRIVDVFPPTQQPQIRLQLATVIEGVVSQVLIPRKDGRGRVCAQEIMTVTTAVRTMIREGKTHQLTSVLQSGGQSGMQTMDRALTTFVERDLIAVTEALKYCRDPEVFKRFQRSA